MPRVRSDAVPTDRDIDVAVREFDGDNVLTGSFSGTLTASASRRIEAERAVFVGVDLTGCDLSRSRFYDCEFTNCVLDGTKLAGVRLDGTRFDTCSLAGVDLAESDFLNVVAVRSKFSYCNLSSAILTNVVIDGCPALDVVFDGSQLRDVRLTNCQLDGSTFHKAGVHAKSQLDLRGSNLDRVAGLLGIGALLVDSAQSVSIAALLLAERRVEISDDPPRAAG